MARYQYEKTKHSQIKKYLDAAGRTRYVVRYWKPDGRQTDKTGLRTLKAAQDWLASTDVSKNSGKFISASAGRITVGELAGPWLAHKKAIRKRSSFDALDGAWRTHVDPRWGGVRISNVRVTDVRAWIGELAEVRSATVVIRCAGVLGGILDGAVDDGLLVKNPARGLELPKKVRKARRRYLTAEEVEDVARAAGETAPMYRLVVLLLAYTGLRWGEMAALTTTSVSPLKKRLEVWQAVTVRGSDWIVGTTKGDEARSVPVPASVMDELEALMLERGPGGLLFPAPRTSSYLRTPNKASLNKKGEKVKPKWWEKALDECGISYMSPHDLRHTAASLAISAGANVKALQRMLGHESASVTLDTYAELFDDDLDAVGDALEEYRRTHNLPTPSSATG